MKQLIFRAVLAFLVVSIGVYVLLSVGRPMLEPELGALKEDCAIYEARPAFSITGPKSCEDYARKSAMYERSQTIYSVGSGSLAVLLMVIAWIIARARENDPRRSRPAKQKTPETPAPSAIGHAPVPGGSRYMAPIELFEDPSKSGSVRLEDRDNAMRPKNGFGRAQWAEPQLLEKIRNEPSNMAARMDLMDLYIEQDRKTEAAQLARTVIKTLVGINEHNRAYDLYRRLNASLGHVELGVRTLAGLVDQRLVMRDTDNALELFERLYGQDPNFNKIPDLICRLVRLLAAQRGGKDELTRHWYNEAIQRFSGCEETDRLIEDLGQSNADLGSVVTAEVVRTMIANHQYSQAINSLLAETALVAQIDPLDLYPITRKLGESQNGAPKAAMIMELMVRAHLDHASTPMIVMELIDLYLTRLNKHDRAESWGKYVIKRWPQSQDAARVRELVKVE
jgi:hypothetical protein